MATLHVGKVHGGAVWLAELLNHHTSGVHTNAESQGVSCSGNLSGASPRAGLAHVADVLVRSARVITIHCQLDNVVTPTDIESIADDVPDFPAATSTSPSNALE